ncbi:hypothetical protein IFM89_016203 [Coptis chinensis]|uniref:Uncharacterized protein n=1 Tax=Coptis chinensis TaxID=261450 RepID=A0A835MA40_9MAGN|nr:hypothetical protein IFM89_016203 [Coptis chinensis]
METEAETPDPVAAVKLEETKEIICSQIETVANKAPPEDLQKGEDEINLPPATVENSTKAEKMEVPQSSKNEIMDPDIGVSESESFSESPSLAIKALGEIDSASKDCEDQLNPVPKKTEALGNESRLQKDQTKESLEVIDNTVKDDKTDARVDDVALVRLSEFPTEKQNAKENTGEKLPVLPPITASNELSAQEGNTEGGNGAVLDIIEQTNETLVDDKEGPVVELQQSDNIIHHLPISDDQGIKAVFTSQGIEEDKAVFSSQKDKIDGKKSGEDSDMVNDIEQEPHYEEDTTAGNFETHNISIKEEAKQSGFREAKVECIENEKYPEDRNDDKKEGDVHVDTILNISSDTTSSKYHSNEADISEIKNPSFEMIKEGTSLRTRGGESGSPASTSSITLEDTSLKPLGSGKEKDEENAVEHETEDSNIIDTTERVETNVDEVSEQSEKKESELAPEAKHSSLDCKTNDADDSTDVTPIGQVNMEPKITDASEDIQEGVKEKELDVKDLTAKVMGKIPGNERSKEDKEPKNLEGEVNEELKKADEDKHNENNKEEDGTIKELSTVSNKDENEAIAKFMVSPVIQVHEGLNSSPEEDAEKIFDAESESVVALDRNSIREEIVSNSSQGTEVCQELEITGAGKDAVEENMDNPSVTNHSTVFCGEAATIEKSQEDKMEAIENKGEAEESGLSKELETPESADKVESVRLLDEEEQHENQDIKCVTESAGETLQNKNSEELEDNCIRSSIEAEDNAEKIETTNVNDVKDLYKSQDADNIKETTEEEKIHNEISEKLVEASSLFPQVSEQRKEELTEQEEGTNDILKIASSEETGSEGKKLSDVSKGLDMATSVSSIEISICKNEQGSINKFEESFPEEIKDRLGSNDTLKEEVVAFTDLGAMGEDHKLVGLSEENECVAVESQNKHAGDSASTLQLLEDPVQGVIEDSDVVTEENGDFPKEKDHIKESAEIVEGEESIISQQAETIDGQSEDEKEQKNIELEPELDSEATIHTTSAAEIRIENEEVCDHPRISDLSEDIEKVNEEESSVKDISAVCTEEEAIDVSLEEYKRESLTPAGEVSRKNECTEKEVIEEATLKEHSTNTNGEEALKDNSQIDEQVFECLEVAKGSKDIEEDIIEEKDVFEDHSTIYTGESTAKESSKEDDNEDKKPEEEVFLELEMPKDIKAHTTEVAGAIDTNYTEFMGEEMVIERFEENDKETLTIKEDESGDEKASAGKDIEDRTLEMDASTASFTAPIEEVKTSTREEEVHERLGETNAVAAVKIQTTEELQAPEISMFPVREQTIKTGSQEEEKEANVSGAEVKESTITYSEAGTYSTKEIEVPLMEEEDLTAFSGTEAPVEINDKLSYTSTKYAVSEERIKEELPDGTENNSTEHEPSPLPMVPEKLSLPEARKLVDACDLTSVEILPKIKADGGSSQILDGEHKISNLDANEIGDTFSKDAVKGKREKSESSDEASVVKPQSVDKDIETIFAGEITDSKTFSADTSYEKPCPMLVSQIQELESVKMKEMTGDEPPVKYEIMDKDLEVVQTKGVINVQKEEHLNDEEGSEKGIKDIEKINLNPLLDCEILASEAKAADMNLESEKINELNEFSQNSIPETPDPDFKQNIVKDKEKYDETSGACGNTETVFLDKKDNPVKELDQNFKETKEECNVLESKLVGINCKHEIDETYNAIENVTLVQRAADPCEEMKKSEITETIDRDQSQTNPETEKIEVVKEEEIIQDPGSVSIDDHTVAQSFQAEEKEKHNLEEVEYKSNAEVKNDHMNDVNHPMEDTIVNKEMPHGVERADENENIEKQTIEEDVAAKDVEALADNKLVKEVRDSDFRSTECNTEVLYCNEKTEAETLTYVKDLNEKVVENPDTEASGEEILKHSGCEKLEEVNNALSDVSENNMKKDIKEEEGDTGGMGHTAPVIVVTEEVSAQKAMREDKKSVEGFGTGNEVKQKQSNDDLSYTSTMSEELIKEEIPEETENTINEHEPASLTMATEELSLQDAEAESGKLVDAYDLNSKEIYLPIEPTGYSSQGLDDEHVIHKQISNADENVTEDAFGIDADEGKQEKSESPEEASIVVPQSGCEKLEEVNNALSDVSENNMKKDIKEEEGDTGGMGHTAPVIVVTEEVSAQKAMHEDKKSVEGFGTGNEVKQKQSNDNLSYTSTMSEELIKEEIPEETENTSNEHEPASLTMATEELSLQDAEADSGKLVDAYDLNSEEIYLPIEATGYSSQGLDDEHVIHKQISNADENVTEDAFSIDEDEGKQEKSESPEEASIVVPQSGCENLEEVNNALSDVSENNMKKDIKEEEGDTGGMGHTEPVIVVTEEVSAQKAMHEDKKSVEGFGTGNEVKQKQSNDDLSYTSTMSEELIKEEIPEETENTINEHEPASLTMATEELSLQDAEAESGKLVDAYDLNSKEIYLPIEATGYSSQGLDDEHVIHKQISNADENVTEDAFSIDADEGKQEKSESPEEASIVVPQSVDKDIEETFASETTDSKAFSADSSNEKPQECPMLLSQKQELESVKMKETTGDEPPLNYEIMDKDLEVVHTKEEINVQKNEHLNAEEGSEIGIKDIEKMTLNPDLNCEILTSETKAADVNLESKKINELNEFSQVSIPETPDRDFKQNIIKGEEKYDAFTEELETTGTREECNEVEKNLDGINAKHKTNESYNTTENVTLVQKNVEVADPCEELRKPDITETIDHNQVQTLLEAEKIEVVKDEEVKHHQYSGSTEDHTVGQHFQAEEKENNDHEEVESKLNPEVQNDHMNNPMEATTVNNEMPDGVERAGENENIEKQAIDEEAAAKDVEALADNTIVREVSDSDFRSTGSMETISHEETSDLVTQLPNEKSGEKNQEGVTAENDGNCIQGSDHPAKDTEESSEEDQKNAEAVVPREMSETADLARPEKTIESVSITQSSELCEEDSDSEPKRHKWSVESVSEVQVHETQMVAEVTEDKEDEGAAKGYNTLSVGDGSVGESFQEEEKEDSVKEAESKFEAEDDKNKKTSEANEKTEDDTVSEEVPTWHENASEIENNETQFLEEQEAAKASYLVTTDQNSNKESCEVDEEKIEKVNEKATRLDTDEQNPQSNAKKVQIEGADEANETPDIEYSNEEVTEGPKDSGASHNTEKQVIQEEESVEDPHLVSVGEESLQKSQQGEAMFEEVPITLETEKPCFESEGVQEEGRKTIESTEKEMTNEVIKSSDLVLEEQNIIQEDVTDKTETASRKLDAPPVKNAPSEEAPMEVSKELEESDIVPEDPINEMVAKTSENKGSAAKDETSLEDFVEDEKSCNSVSRTMSMEESHIKEELPADNPDASLKQMQEKESNSADDEEKEVEVVEQGTYQVSLPIEENEENIEDQAPVPDILKEGAKKLTKLNSQEKICANEEGETQVHKQAEIPQEYQMPNETDDASAETQISMETDYIGKTEEETAISSKEISKNVIENIEEPPADNPDAACLTEASLEETQEEEGKSTDNEEKEEAVFVKQGTNEVIIPTEQNEKNVKDEAPVAEKSTDGVKMRSELNTQDKICANDEEETPVLKQAEISQDSNMVNETDAAPAEKQIFGEAEFIEKTQEKLLAVQKFHQCQRLSLSSPYKELRLKMVNMESLKETTRQ